MFIKDFEDLLKEVVKKPKVKVSVAAAADREVLTAVKMAEDMGFVEPILVGDETEIRKIAEEIGLKNYRVVDCPDPADAAKKAVELVRNKEAGVLMKGLVNTSVYMRALLNRENGLRGGGLLSLLAVYELPQYHKLIYCTDSGINVAPTLEQKKDIMTNALNAMKRIGMENPKTAILSSNELVDPKIPSTVDAAALAEMVEKGEIPSCIAEGPMAFDVAFDAHAAAHKGIDSKIAGDVDLLVFPNIETGNVLGKSWLRFNQAKWAGIVLGGTSPIILGSRSDTAELKLNSIALACLASM